LLLLAVLDEVEVVQPLDLLGWEVGEQARDGTGARPAVTVRCAAAVGRVDIGTGK